MPHPLKSILAALDPRGPGGRGEGGGGEAERTRRGRGEEKTEEKREEERKGGKRDSPACTRQEEKSSVWPVVSGYSAERELKGGEWIHKKVEERPKEKKKEEVGKIGLLLLGFFLL